MQATVAELLAHSRRPDVVPGSFAKLLLSTLEGDNPLSDDGKILPEIATIFFAAVDTTGHTLTWILCVVLFCVLKNNLLHFFLTLECVSCLLHFTYHSERIGMCKLRHGDCNSHLC